MSSINLIWINLIWLDKQFRSPRTLITAKPRQQTTDMRSAESFPGRLLWGYSCRFLSFLGREGKGRQSGGALQGNLQISQKKWDPVWWTYRVQLANLQRQLLTIIIMSDPHTLVYPVSRIKFLVYSNPALPPSRIFAGLELQTNKQTNNNNMGMLNNSLSSYLCWSYYESLVLICFSLFLLSCLIFKNTMLFARQISWRHCYAK